MKKYQYLASWDDQTLTRVGEPVVVLGDSNVSQVEVTLPSNFLLDPTKAECRMYFLLPGEKESNHDILETAVKDENGDSHVTWTIKHVHSQKGGRLAFSLTLIGDDAQWDSRTAIIPVYESRYQPESEEAEEPYTGRLDALEGSMASIRGEFAEVQEDFEDLKETATLGTPIPESLVTNMQEGHVYIYTGTEPGYTAGHVYYYVGGALTDGGVYGGTAVDATLTQSGKAADAAVTGAEISVIKEDLSAIDERVEDLEEGGGGGGVFDTVTGESVTFATNATSPKALSVAVESTIPDTSGATPTSPVSIAGIASETFTVNGTDKVVTFSNPIGKGTWNVLSGEVVDERPVVDLTADMVKSLASFAGYYAIILDIQTPLNANGIVACTHYPIKSTASSPCIRYVSAQNRYYIYDNSITENNLQTAKDYITNLGAKLVLDVVTPVEFSETPETITLTEGENTVAVSTGEMTLTYAVDVKGYVDGKVASVEDTADEALDIANGLDARVTANAELSKSNEQKVYKFRTDEGANTGTGSAGASSSINWGIQLNIDENIEKCYSITFTPSFPSTITGEYTATRWKKASGTPADGDVLTKIAEITKSVGESVTFEKVGTNEFISLNKSCYRSSDGSSAVGVPYVKIGHIDPSTGVFTSFSGVLSGTFSVTFYKAIKDDSMPLYGKKVALVGDSITEKNGRANTNHAMYLNQWTGAQIQNLGVGGTGFSTNNKYKDRIANIKADTELIGVAASLNDMRNTVGTASDTAEAGTVCGYANEFFDLLLASFPSIPIVCYSEGPWEAYRPGITKSDTYMEQMEQICLNKGIAWDDGLYRGCALRPWVQENREALYKGESGSYIDVVDNVHPNSAGQKYIAIYLKGLFEKYVR